MRGLVNLASLSLSCSLSLSLNINIYSLAEETASDPRNIPLSPVQKFDYIPLHSKIRLNEHTLLTLFLNCTDLLCKTLHRFGRYTKTMFLFLAVTGKRLF